MAVRRSIDSDKAFLDYLEQREADLTRLHPQWDYSNAEIINLEYLSKRNLTPICIPPSWDLIQNSDGFDGFDAKSIGDQGEAAFLWIMQNLPVGGILIGNIHHDELKNGRKFRFYNLPESFTNELSGNNAFQFDFIYFHAFFGIIHFEVKNTKFNPKMHAFQRRAHLNQVKKHQQTLRQLFQLFLKFANYDDQYENCWDRYFYGSILFYNRETGYGNNDNNNRSGHKLIAIVHGKTELERFLVGLQLRDNLLTKPILRKFIVFLAGYRPDDFVVPGGAIAA